MAGALDDFEDFYGRAMAGGEDDTAPLSGAGGALSQVDVNDPDSRKEVFARATQRILDARNAMQKPYDGNDLGMLNFGAEMSKGGSIASNYSNAMLQRALGQQKQQEATEGYQQQQGGMDLQADLARIMGNGGSLQDTSALAAIGGQDKIADSLSKLQLYDTRTHTGQGATIQAAYAIQAANPGMDFTTAYSLAKQGAGQGNTVKDGEIAPIGGSIDTAAKRKTAETTAEEQAKADVEKKKLFPKATASLNNAFAGDEIVNKTIDDVLPNVNTWTAGFIGSAASKVPGTPAYDLDAKLKTIKANLGFDKLQEMRDSSPTGGAIGQVSDFEEKLLSSAVQNVENAQSPSQLKEALLHLKQIKAGQKVRLKQAYLLDYGKFLPNAESPDQQKPATSLTADQARAILAARRAKK